MLKVHTSDSAQNGGVGHGCIITRIAGRRSAHRAFRESADPKLTVPLAVLGLLNSRRECAGRVVAVGCQFR
jgi:hypothetical protein